MMQRYKILGVRMNTAIFYYRVDLKIIKTKDSFKSFSTQIIFAISTQFPVQFWSCKSCGDGPISHKRFLKYNIKYLDMSKKGSRTFYSTNLVLAAIFVLHGSLFVVYLTTLFQQLRLHRIEWKGDKWMIIIIWKEVVVAQFEVLARHSPGGTEKHVKPKSG
jgi:hypothetical protein